MLSIYILLTILTWGFAHVFIKKGMTYFSPLQSYIIDTVIAVIIWTPFAIWQGVNFTTISFSYFPIMILLGLNVGLFYFVVNKGPISILSPIIAVYPALTVILAHKFLNELLSYQSVLGIIFAIIGLVLISLPKKLIPVQKKWILLAIVNSAGWGIEGLTNKYVIDRSGNGMFILILALGQILTIAFWYLKDKPKNLFPKIPPAYVFPTVLGVFLWNFGTITYAKAMENGQTSLITPFTNLYVVVTVIGSLFFLKEKIRKIQWAGIISIVMGLIIIQLPKDLFKFQHVSNDIKQQTNNNLSEAPNAPTTYNSQLTTSYVVYVYDGDTVQIKNGTHIRLIGIDAPEDKQDKKEFECFGKEAGDMLRKLILNQPVELEPDKEELDQYGRTLRYIWADDVFINEFMVRQGLARAIAIKPNIKYYSLLKSAETEAKTNKRGLWGKCADWH